MRPYLLHDSESFITVIFNVGYLCDTLPKQDSHFERKALGTQDPQVKYVVDL